MTRHAVIVDPLSTGQDYPLAFRAAGCAPVAVLSEREPALADTWHPERFDRVHVFDGDDERLAAELRAYAPDYLVAGSEFGVELTDRLTELVAPGTGNAPELIAARRDKWAMHQALARAGVPRLRQFCSADPDAIAAWVAAQPPGPLVLKPPKSGGADNVRLVPAGADWRPAFDAILGALNTHGKRNEAVLVSEYAEGVELLVDTYSAGGRHGLVDVCRYARRRIGEHIGIYDCVEFLPPDDPDVAAAWPYTRAVLDAVGIRNGCGHVEVMLTAAGPRLIEVAARPAGGGHQTITALATGDNQIERTVAHRLRGELRRGYELRRHLRAAFVSAPRGGVWRNAHVFDGVDALATFHSKHFPYGSGDVVPPTRDLASFLAWVVLLSEDRDAVAADYERIKAWESEIEIS
jgi:ATP-grasp domain